MIEELRRFILVAKNGNVSRTAESIFITQSALSQSIKRLEKELNTKLFIQKGKTLHITPDGNNIVEIGTRILELWNKAKNPTATRSIRPTYAIGLFDSIALHLGKYFMKYTNHESFNFDLTIDASEKLLSQVQLGILDAAICVMDINRPPANDIVLLKTFIEKLIPVSSKKFKGRIQKIPFILYNKGSNTRNQIDEVFIKKDIKPNIFAESTSISFMKKLAILGSGVAILPQNYIEAEIKQGILKKQRLSLKWQREYGIFVNKHSSLQKDSLIINDLIKNLT